MSQDNEVIAKLLFAVKVIGFDSRKQKIAEEYKLSTEDIEDYTVFMVKQRYIRENWVRSKRIGNNGEKQFVGYQITALGEEFLKKHSK